MRGKLISILLNIAKTMGGTSNFPEIYLDSFLLVDPKVFSSDVDILYNSLQDYNSAPILM